MGLLSWMTKTLDGVGRTEASAPQPCMMQTAMSIVDRAVAEAEAEARKPVLSISHPAIAEALDLAYRQAANTLDKVATGQDWERSCLNVGELMLLGEQNLAWVARKCGLGLGATASAVVDAFHRAKFDRVNGLYRGVAWPPADHSSFVQKYGVALRPRLADAYRHEQAKATDNSLGLQFASVSEAERVVLETMLEICKSDLEYDAVMVAVFALSAELKHELCRQAYGG